MNSADNKRELVNALLAALPPDRRVQLRTVDHLRLFVPNGMTEQQAFDPSFIGSRLGHHNDCFMVNQSDAGTYAWGDPQRTIDRNYLQGMSKYMPIGGEMCGDVPEAGSDPYNRRTPRGSSMNSPALTGAGFPTTSATSIVGGSGASTTPLPASWATALRSPSR